MGEALHDPVLALHRHSPRHYELGALPSTGLRDDLLRASLLVERLLLAEELQPDDPQSGLLVIGGGPAGACAAWGAALRGVHTVLVAPGPLMARLHAAGGRTIDPVAQDWPQPHWDAQRFPPVPQAGPSPLPFEFPAGPAASLAQNWCAALQGWMAGPHNQGAQQRLWLLKRRAQAGELRRYPYPPRNSQREERRVLFKPTGQRRYGAVLACTGAGPEPLAAPGGRYISPPFWATEQLDAAPPLRNQAGGVLRLLVVGGGDAAQEEFLRAATGSGGRELFQRLGLPALLARPEERFRLDGLLLAEDAARRALAWRSPAAPAAEPAALAAWHQPFEVLAGHIWQAWLQEGQVAQHLSVLREAEVVWAMPGAVPGPCHALNRLLSLLVARLKAHQKPPGRRKARPTAGGDAAGRMSGPPAGVIRPNAELLSVQGDGHACGDAQACFGLPHQVRLGDGTGEETFDAVLLRHGPSAQGRRFFGGGQLHAQPLPYRWP